MRILSDLLGTLKKTFRIARAMIRVADSSPAPVVELVEVDGVMYLPLKALDIDVEQVLLRAPDGRMTFLRPGTLPSPLPSPLPDAVPFSFPSDLGADGQILATDGQGNHRYVPHNLWSPWSPGLIPSPSSPTTPGPVTPGPTPVSPGGLPPCPSTLSNMIAVGAALGPLSPSETLITTPLTTDTIHRTMIMVDEAFDGSPMASLSVGVDSDPERYVQEIQVDLSVPGIPIEFFHFSVDEDSDPHERGIKAFLSVNGSTVGSVRVMVVLSEGI